MLRFFKSGKYSKFDHIAETFNYPRGGNKKGLLILIITFHNHEGGNIFWHQWQLLERNRQKFCNSANQIFFHRGNKVRQDKIDM